MRADERGLCKVCEKFLESGGEYICMECLEDMSVSELLEIAGMELSEAR